MAFIDSLRAKPGFTLFVIYLRYLIGGAFIYAGMGKVLGERFTQPGSLQIPATGMTIDVFFETLYQTKVWWRFMGWGQLISGFLVVTQRWSTLGAVAFLPISLNIFVITLSMDFHGTPLITSLLVLANIGLLCWDYAKLKVLFLPNRDSSFSVRLNADQLGYPRYWEGIGLLLFFTSISFGNRGNPPLWFVVCCIEGLLGLLGWWLLRRRK